MSSGDNKPRTIKLFCPSVSKVVRLMAWDAQKLDLGSIARAFGLEPSTVKLNGHFISRGVDLVSSSVTWRSLLSFFSSKGLSTGTDEKGGALIVDGKLCRVGTKRGGAHEFENGVNGNEVVDGGVKDVGNTAKLELEEIYWLKNKKTRDNYTNSCSSSGCSVSKPDMGLGIGCKRNSLMEDFTLLKKLKINNTKSDLQGRGKSNSSTVLSTPFKCSYSSGNTKRTREDEVIVAASCKRINSGCQF